MSVIRLTKELKIKLLNSIESGMFDTSQFPELLLDAPQEIDCNTLSEERLDQIIAIWEKNLKK